MSFVYNLPRLCTSNVDRFTLKKAKPKRYPADSSNADNLGPLANAPPQAEALLYNLEQSQ